MVARSWEKINGLWEWNFMFFKMESCGYRQWCWLQTGVNVLNATGSYTLNDRLTGQGAGPFGKALRKQTCIPELSPQNP